MTRDNVNRTSIEASNFQLPEDTDDLLRKFKGKFVQHPQHDKRVTSSYFGHSSEAEVRNSVLPQENSNRSSLSYQDTTFSVGDGEFADVQVRVVSVTTTTNLEVFTLNVLHRMASISSSFGNSLSSALPISLAPCLRYGEVHADGFVIPNVALSRDNITAPNHLAPGVNAQHRVMQSPPFSVPALWTPAPNYSWNADTATAESPLLPLEPPRGLPMPPKRLPGGPLCSERPRGLPPLGTLAGFPPPGPPGRLLPLGPPEGRGEALPPPGHPFRGYSGGPLEGGPLQPLWEAPPGGLPRGGPPGGPPGYSATLYTNGWNAYFNILVAQIKNALQLDEITKWDRCKSTTIQWFVGVQEVYGNNGYIPWQIRQHLWICLKEGSAV